MTSKSEPIFLLPYDFPYMPVSRPMMANKYFVGILNGILEFPEKW